MLACAARPTSAGRVARPPRPPRAAHTPSTRLARERAPDPPHTRRIGEDAWSVAVSDEWERRVSDDGTHLHHTGAPGTQAMIAREPRPRGGADEAFAQAVDEWREVMRARGLVFPEARPVVVDREAGRSLSLRRLHAGRDVRALLHVEVRGRRYGVATCVAPRVAEPQSDECRRIIAGLRVDEAVEPAASRRRVLHEGASVEVPASWFDVDTDGAIAESHSGDGPDALSVVVEGGETDSAAGFFREVDAHYRELEATTLRRAAGRRRGVHTLDLDVTYTVPLEVEVTVLLALHGPYLYGITCAEPTTETSAGRRRCPSLLATFHFDAP